MAPPPLRPISKTPLDLKTVLAPILYDAQGQPVMADGDPWHGRELAPGAPFAPTLPAGNEPRQWFPWVGYNLAFMPRAESPSLTPFQILRQLASICDPLKNAMNDVKGEVLGFGWDVKAKDEKSQTQTTAIAAVKDWLKSPDKIHDFQGWLYMVLDEQLVIDALSMYRQRTVDGDPYAVRILDGTTIKPLVDFHGTPPAPPFPAYQQVGFGRVETEFTMPWRNAEPFQPDGNPKCELVYKVAAPRSWTPYGESPVERLIPTINLYVRRYLHYLGFYTEGNVPEAFWKCPDTWTPEQIETAQSILDQLLVGNPKLRSRLRLMAGGEGTGLEDPRSHDTWSSDFDEALKRDIYAAFNASPIGVVRMMNRATSQQADAAESDSGTKFRKGFIAGLINREIEEFLGYDGVEFMWKEEKQSDERLQMEKNVAYVGEGIFTVDEVRESEGKAPMTPEQKAEANAAPVPGAPGAGGPPGKPPAHAGAAAAPAGEEKIPPQSRLAVPGLTRAALQDLKRWQKVAAKDLASRRPPRPFQTTAVPTALRTALDEWIRHSKTAEDLGWGFAVLVRARRPLLQARQRIRLEMGLRAAALEHFRKRAPAVAQLVRHAYHPALERDEAAKDETPSDAQIDGVMDWKVFVGKVEPHLRTAFADGGELGIQKVGDEAIAFGMLDQAAADYAEDRAAELVGMRRLDDGTLVQNPHAKWSVAQTVRDRIQGLVAKAVKEGWTRDRLAGEIEDGTIWETRADAIARSEVSIAVNQGAAKTYGEAGVQRVTILDGPGCLRDGHDDSEDGVNGETWSLEEFQEYPIGHPHCRREGIPDVDSIDQEAA